MSSVQPPGLPVPARKPCVANAPTGFGHVVAFEGIGSVIANGALVKALVKVAPVTESVQVAGSAGGARLTSFCSRHVYGVPVWLTWRVFAASAAERPSTPSQ